MKRWTRRLSAPTLALVVLAACHGQHAAPDARDHPYIEHAVEETPPTLQDAARATYWGGLARQVTLEDGTFMGPDGQRVELVRQFYVTGDLEGDGAVDTAVILSVTNAGPENGHYLAVIRHLGLDTISLGTTLLGDTVEVERLAVDGRRIVVDLTRHPDGAPAQPARLTYELGRGELLKIGEATR